MKKRQMLNLIMILAVIAIAAAGILTAGSILGWFDGAPEETAELAQLRGIVTLQRDGIACRASAETALRKGDRIETAAGAEAEVQVGSSRLTLGEKTELVIECPETEHFSAAVGKGEIFALGETPLSLSFDADEVQTANAAVSLRVCTGMQSVSVYSGSLPWKDNTIDAGQTLSLQGEEEKIAPCRESGLSDFLLRQLRSVPGETELCFSAAELDRLMRERQEALGQAPADRTEAWKKPEETVEPALEKETVPEKTEEITEEKTEPSEMVQAATETTEETAAETTSSDTTAAAELSEPSEETEASSETELPEETEAPSETGLPEETQPETTEEATQPQSTCTVTIRCDTILEHMDRLDPGKAEFVPEGGMILWGAEVGFEEGETAFDAVKRACEKYGIQLEYSWTPMYDSYYIEGINCLYEFDCGSESGWMFKVNGALPNYGCSEYPLKDGDRVEFCYSCSGLGTDVGGGVG